MTSRSVLRAPPPPSPGTPYFAKVKRSPKPEVIRKYKNNCDTVSIVLFCFHLHKDVSAKVKEYDFNGSVLVCRNSDLTNAEVECFNTPVILLHVSCIHKVKGFSLWQMPRLLYQNRGNNNWRQLCAKGYWRAFSLFCWGISKGAEYIIGTKRWMVCVYPERAFLELSSSYSC